MKSKQIAFLGLTAAGLSLMLSSQRVIALDMVQEKSSVTEQTTTEGNPTIIQRIDSKMEPTVVQSRMTKDPETGEKQTVVEPMIMERHDKVLDTTILQPQVNEVRRTTEQVTSSKESSRAPVVHKSATTYRLTPKHVCRKRSSGTHRIAYRAHHDATASTAVKETTQTTEIVRQPVVKETIIKNPQGDAPPEAPQVIQKTESN